MAKNTQGEQLVTFKLPKKIYKKFKIKCVEENKKIKDVLLELIEKWLEK